jgi:hypothetical protein
VVSVTDPLRSYSRFSRTEPLLFLPSSSSIVLTKLLSGPRYEITQQNAVRLKSYAIFRHPIEKPKGRHSYSALVFPSDGMIRHSVFQDRA